MATSNQTETTVQPGMLEIDIVSDVVCPWCVVGYKQLEKALKQFSPALNVNIRWQPFQLDPEIPQGGQNNLERMLKMYQASAEQSAAMRQRLIDRGSELGFSFNYTDESRTYNTFKAHQLLHWAGLLEKESPAQKGLQTRLQMQLFYANFTEQKAVDEIDVLVESAEKVGLNIDLARNILIEETYAEVVETAIANCRNSGVKSVPAFIFSQKYLISGAQEPDDFVNVIERVLSQNAS